ncbi:MAG: TRAP transporter small permease [Reyranellaceae bacterium]
MTDASIPKPEVDNPHALKGIWATLDGAVGRLIDLVTMALLVALFLLICWIVLGRLLQLGSPAWTDEIVEFLLAWLIFLGAAGLWRRGEQFRVDLIDQMMDEGWRRRGLALLVEILSVAFLAALTWYGLRFALRITDTSPTWALPRIYWFIVMPLSSFVMLVYSLVRIGKLVRKEKTP